MIIREMREEDLPEIMPIEKRIFSSPWPLKAYRDELRSNPFAQLYVTEDERGITGYCDLWILYEQAQIATIGVREDCRREGIAQLMLDEMVRRAEQAHCEVMSLEVRVSNEKAIRLYEKNGFIQAIIRRHYYTDNGEDAWLMVKPLGGYEDDDDTGD